MAVVFLADRLAKWLLPQPSKWTAAAGNALAALLCHWEHWAKCNALGRSMVKSWDMMD